jgi:cell wall-associated NlpC family hydrolase
MVATVGFAAGARGEPVTDDDVEAARAAATSTATAVAAIELELAATAAAVEDAWQAVAVAAEDHTEALVAQDEADVAADEAQMRSVAAAELLEEARAELGRIALEAHRSGGSLDGVAVLLSADGMEDYVARSTAIERLGTRADRALQRFEAAELVAGSLAARAEGARKTAAEAANVAEATLQRAKDLQAAAEAEVTRVAAEREALIVRLAELRRTSAEVERARQATIDADRAARAGATVGGGTGTPSPPPSPPPPSGDPPPAGSDPYGLGTGSQRGSAALGETAVAWALQQVGKPYVYGAAGPDAFDCSGLSMRAWGVAGVTLNRSSRDQYRQVYKISYDSMRPGDLIFSGTVSSDPGSVYHVAMYIGNGQVVEASRPGIPLRVAPVRWTNAMPYAGRP